MPAETKASVRARLACPAFAIGYPSKVVATDEGSPGILNRMDVVDPPNNAPQYMQESRIIAEIGSSENVSRKSRETPLGAPNPGRTPTRIPSVTPSIISKT